MPYIRTPLITEDETPTAAELNQPYDDLATASSAIDGDNIAAGALRHQHLFLNPSVLFDYEDPNSTNINDISSTTYVTLTRGVTPTEIDFGVGYPLEQFQPLRISGTGLVTNCDFDVRWDEQGGNLGKPGLYAFRILITYDIGAGNLQTSLGEWGYSFGTASSTDKLSTLNTGDSSNISICYQTFQFEGIWRAPGANTVIKKIELQAKVFDATNVLRISRNALHTIIGER